MLTEDSIVKTDDTRQDSDMHTFTFADDSVGKESFSLFSPIDRQKHCKVPPSERCTYVGVFLRIVKFLRIRFENFKTEELIYESERIYRGELKALDRFILRAEANQTNPRFAIEDLLLDEFFEAEDLSELYSEYMEKKLVEEENQAGLSKSKGTQLRPDSTHHAKQTTNKDKLDLKSKTSLLSEVAESGRDQSEWPNMHTSFFEESQTTLYGNFEKFIMSKVAEEKQKLSNNIDVIKKTISWNQERRKVFLSYLDDTLKTGQHVFSEE